MENVQKINDELTLHIDGIASNGGDVDLSVFANKLDSLRLALQETDKHLLGMNKSSVDFFVTDLNHSSPSAITIGMKPSDNIFEHQSNIFDYFSNLVADITSGKYRPASANYQTLKKLSELASGIGDKFSSMWFTRHQETVAVVNFETLSALNDLLSKQYKSYGSVKGKVKLYSSASKDKCFYIFPLLGGRVKCIFDDDLIDTASKIVESCVTVNGTISYLEGEFFPSEIKVHTIELHDIDSNLTSLSSLLGAEENATGDLTSVDFVKEARDGWN